MKRIMAVLVILFGLLSPLLATPASAADSGPHDDYPYRTDTTQGSDPWGFTKRQCVSFGAWRLKQAGIPLSNKGNAWGNGEHWDEAARTHHVHLAVTPVVGAVAQWNGLERSRYWAPNGGTGFVQAGRLGHVGVVLKVYPDKSALIEQYNMSGNRSYSRIRARAPRYLYFTK